MKYMMMVKLDGESDAGQQYKAGMPPDAKLVEAMGKLIDKMLKSGVMVGTGGLLPVATGARIRAASGKLSMTDGPYIECKEVIGGYAIIEVGSKKEALNWGEEFMKLHVDILGPSFVGELEIRQMMDHQDGTCGGPQP